MTKVILGLGANMGNREAYLEAANQRLQPIARSNIYETDAILPENAPPEWNIPYLNMAVLIETDKKPHALLKYIKQIESDLGRDNNNPVWSPREIDIDILIYEGVEINTPTLTIPHKELKNRPFFIKCVEEIRQQP